MLQKGAVEEGTRVARGQSRWRRTREQQTQDVKCRPDRHHLQLIHQFPRLSKLYRRLVRREQARLGFARERSKIGNTPKCILKYTQNTPFSQNTVYIKVVYTLYKILYTFDTSLTKHIVQIPQLTRSQPSSRSIIHSACMVIRCRCIRAGQRCVLMTTVPLADLKERFLLGFVVRRLALAYYANIWSPAMPL